MIEETDSRLNEMRVNVYQDFLATPQIEERRNRSTLTENQLGRLFLKSILEPSFLSSIRNQSFLVVNLDGCGNYSDDFLHSSFGKLSDKYGPDSVNIRLIILSEDSPELINRIRDFIDNHDCYNFNRNFSKADLQSGMRVKLRNGNTYLVIRDCATAQSEPYDLVFVSRYGYMLGQSYTDKLDFRVSVSIHNDRNPDWDIVEVSISDTVSGLVHGKSWKTIWRRK